MPGGAVFSSATSSGGGACTESNNTITCAIGTLAASGSDTVTIAATLSSSGTATNNITVVANESEPNLVDNSTVISTIVGSLLDTGTTTNGNGAAGLWFLGLLALWNIALQRRTHS